MHPLNHLRCDEAETGAGILPIKKAKAGFQIFGSRRARVAPRTVHAADSAARRARERAQKLHSINLLVECGHDSRLTRSKFTKQVRVALGADANNEAAILDG